MRRCAAHVAVFALAALLSCSAKTELPPVAPDQVEVFLPDAERPTEPYVIIWYSGNTFAHCPELDESLIDYIKEEAAKRGADAVLIDHHLSCGGSSGRTWGCSERIQVRAICFLRRHPELVAQR
jgi:hypothetical protein